MTRSDDGAVGDLPWPSEAQQLVDAANATRPERQPSADDTSAFVPISQSTDLWFVGSAAIQRFASTEGPAGSAAVIGRLGDADFPVGAVLGSHEEWLVTERVAGESAGRPDLHPDPDDLVVAVGHGLRLLHDLPIETLETDADWPLVDWGWEPVLARCRRRVEDGTLDAKELPHPYDRYQPSELLAMLAEGRPDKEDLVCCHGAAVVDRVMVESGTFRGFDRLDSAVVADRHLDLAVMHLSLQELLGPEAVFRFYDSYGADPDLVRLDHYVLVSHLLDPPPAGHGGGQPIGDARQVTS